MNALEWRATLGLGALYALRMAGMFMVLPVFALYAHGLPGGQDPRRVGLAIGVYGLTQALLQIPLGIASDRWGRKPVIALGMAVFAAGSVVAGLARTVDLIVVGRALQGAGAVSSAVAALLADSTREQVRTQAMTVLGAGMGLSFVLAMVLGPVVSDWIGVDGIFLMTAVLALLALPVVWWVVPGSEPRAARAGGLAEALLDRQMSRLHLGIFLLHAMLTSLFLVLPATLERTLGLPGAQHWKVYLPVLLVSVLPVFPLSRWAEEHGRLRAAFVGAIVLLAAGLAAMTLARSEAVPLVAALLVFFTGFNYLEGALPSLISRLAPPDRKGAALGVYASAQFLGAFAGGVGGGLVQARWGVPGGFGFTAALPLLWLAASAGWRPAIRGIPSRA
ncbi:MAG TPA: MFS transporter [Candidatus Binatia bacterium]|nr:MFS transporter [Candidatus Binatia bacterium]